ncbi:hypothetical protein LN042_11605 [Kitasatospora sp. RB6PN24]|uniref:hypothetical protein n=1 Tax=Kitasatospora humi TaxID=2893891 RepID=UPI001E5AEE2E|nr:hypothetical protein [Kitasatospora humi]MCC9307735.1 hypothetical protein [Kitasatospora humi]
MRSTTTAGLLAQAIARTEPHVRHADDRPELGAIRLDATATHLYAIATDRYTLAIDQIAATTPTPWHAHLHRVDIPQVQLWLDGINPDEEIRIGVAPSGEGTAITLRCGHDMLRIVNRRPEQHQFPNWRQIVTEKLGAPTDPVNLTAYNPNYLARFAAVDQLGLHAWQAGPRRPLFLASDDGFLGMVMPANNETANRAALVAEWSSALMPVGAR